MPITQERMLAIVEECEAHRRALDAQKRQLEEILRGEGDTPSDAGTILGTIQYMLHIWPNPPYHKTAVERYHYDKWHRRNQTERERQTFLRHKAKGLVSGDAPDPSNPIRRHKPRKPRYRDTSPQASLAEQAAFMNSAQTFQPDELFQASPSPTQPTPEQLAADAEVDWEDELAMKNYINREWIKQAMMEGKKLNRLQFEYDIAERWETIKQTLDQAPQPDSEQTPQ